MKFVKILTVCVLSFAIRNTQASDVPSLILAQDGKTDYRIVVDREAAESERTAALELSTYLKKVTGADFPLVKDAPGTSDAHSIFVGQGVAVKKLLPDINFDKLGEDGIVIKTVGSNLILSGGKPRGTLYAVYQFLENAVGCEWWTSKESAIPTLKTLQVPAQNTVYSPPFWYRDAYFRDIWSNPEFAVKMRRNGKVHDPGIPAELGGSLSIIGFVHTFDVFLPSAEYFAAHPEWGGEQGGERKAWAQTSGQLCLTNPEMSAKFTEEVLKRLEDTPKRQVISVSQNDNSNRCVCVKCLEVEKREQAKSGPIIHFVNGIARKVAEKHPNALVETLAYTYSVKPPSRVTPEPNVLIRLCSYFEDHSVPLSDAKNLAFNEALAGWSKISKQLFIWDYTTDFENQWKLRPNLLYLGENIKLFARSKVEGVFSQGPFSQKSDFVGLRAWFISHLLWNPDADSEQLIARYLQGYYGVAAKPLRQYIQLINDTAKSSGIVMSGGGVTQLPFPEAFFVRADELFDAAEASVKDDKVLLRRVQIERLAPDYLRIHRYPELREKSVLLFPTSDAAVEACDRFLKRVEDFGFDVKESPGMAGSTSHLIELARMRCAPVKPLPDEYADPETLDFPAPYLMLHRYGSLTNLVKDEEGAMGHVAEVPASSREWAVQLPATASMKGRPWKGYFRVKYEGEGGTKFTLGMFDAETEKPSGQKVYTLSESDGYQCFAVDADKMEGTNYLYLAPSGDESNKGRLLIDRVILQPR